MIHQGKISLYILWGIKGHWLQLFKCCFLCSVLGPLGGSALFLCAVGHHSLVLNPDLANADCGWQPAGRCIIAHCITFSWRNIHDSSQPSDELIAHSPWCHIDRGGFSSELSLQIELSIPGWQKCKTCIRTMKRSWCGSPRRLQWDAWLRGEA